jgi:hypothetical protein
MDSPMTALPMLTDTDWQLRQFIYTFFVEQTRPPSVEEAAHVFAWEVTAAQAAYERLHQHHHILLETGSHTVRMANPLSALPTRYAVTVNGRRLWANCGWDSLGIPAMLGVDAQIEARDPLTEAPLTYAIRDGKLDAPDYLMHFPLPFQRWYEDVIFT